MVGIGRNFLLPIRLTLDSRLNFFAYRLVSKNVSSRMLCRIFIELVVELRIRQALLSLD